MKHRVGRLAAGSVVVAALALLVYWLGARPRLLNWGVSSSGDDLPGDRLVPEPRYVATRSVTIAAPAAAVWPWLVQIGQGRGGFYSYDWLENLIGCDIHSADRILPEFQLLAAGDDVRLAPEERFALRVVSLDPGRSIVLRTTGSREASFARGDPDASWAFVLGPVGEQMTRLTVRWRADYAPTFRGRLLNHYLLEPVHFVMEQKMLRGIKARAEAAATAPSMAHGRRDPTGCPPEARDRVLPLVERTRRRVEHELDTRSVGLAATLYRRTRGQIARLWGRRVLLLTTRGRKTGRERTVPLQFFPDDRGMVVVAANSGLSTPPGWYANLTADPYARVELMGRVLSVYAQEMAADEATAFWPRLLEIAPDYARYQRRTNRLLPLVRLVPIPTNRRDVR